MSFIALNLRYFASFVSKFSRRIISSQEFASKNFETANFNIKCSILPFSLAFIPILLMEILRHRLVTNSILMVTKFEIDGDKLTISLFEKWIFMVTFWHIYGYSNDLTY